MKTTQLIIETMCSLSVSELKRFNLFLHSPYSRNAHFSNSKVCELFKILQSFFLRFPEHCKSRQPTPFFSWEKASRKLFPGAETPKAKNRKLIKLCSEVISYLLEFFAVERISSGKAASRIAVSEELFRRNLSHTFERFWKVKYFSGIYSEDEVSNVYHRYELIRLANLHKEKHRESYPDYDIELMLINKHRDKMLSDLRARAKMMGHKLQLE